MTLTKLEHTKKIITHLLGILERLECSDIHTRGMHYSILHNSLVLIERKGMSEEREAKIWRWINNAREWIEEATLH